MFIWLVTSLPFGGLTLQVEGAEFSTALLQEHLSLGETVGPVVSGGDQLLLLEV